MKMQDAGSLTPCENPTNGSLDYLKLKQMARFNDTELALGARYPICDLQRLARLTRLKLIAQARFGYQ